jgi:FkbM family methyltransferase
LLRTSLEKISKNVTLKRKLPEQFENREIIVTPGSALRYWKKDLYQIEKHLFDNVLEVVNEGDVVWDIGANIGLYSLSSASIVGSSGFILAVEPNDKTAKLIRRSAENFPDRTIKVLSAAVSEELGIEEFCIAKRGNSTNFLQSSGGSTQTGGVVSKYPVITVSLDWLLESFRKPDVIKIDVEGGELGVLKGASKILTEVRPIIVCEITERNQEEATAIFKKHNYKMYNVDDAPDERKELSFAVKDTIAIPQ